MQGGDRLLGTRLLDVAEDGVEDEDHPDHERFVRHSLGPFRHPGGHRHEDGGKQEVDERVRELGEELPPGGNGGLGLELVRAVTPSSSLCLRGRQPAADVGAEPGGDVGGVEPPRIELVSFGVLVTRDVSHLPVAEQPNGARPNTAGHVRTAGRRRSSTIGSMLPQGVHHWTATHPEWEGPVSAYAIDDGERLVLIDPIAVPDDVRALFGSREVVTVLTSTWHERDAASLGFPVWAPAPDRPEDQLVPATRYAIGDSLFGMDAYPGREGQLDLVLWSERIRAVIAGDTLIDLGNGLEIPASWLPEGVTVEQVAAGLRPLLDKPVEIVLPTHGEPTDRAALERALA